MAAGTPQARISAEIGIESETTDDAFARVNAPGLTMALVRRQGLPDMTRAQAPASAMEKKGPPGPRQDAKAICRVVARLDLGRGSTLDVVRRRKARARSATTAAPERVA